MIVLGNPGGSLGTGVSFSSSHLGRTSLDLGVCPTSSVFVLAFRPFVGCGRDTVIDHQYE